MFFFILQSLLWFLLALFSGVFLGKWLKKLLCNCNLHDSIDTDVNNIDDSSGLSNSNHSDSSNNIDNSSHLDKSSNVGSSNTPDNSDKSNNFSSSNNTDNASKFTPSRVVKTHTRSPLKSHIKTGMKPKAPTKDDGSSSYDAMVNKLSSKKPKTKSEPESKSNSKLNIANVSTGVATATLGTAAYTALKATDNRTKGIDDPTAPLFDESENTDPIHAKVAKMVEKPEVSPLITSKTSSNNDADKITPPNSSVEKTAQGVLAAGMAAAAMASVATKTTPNEDKTDALLDEKSPTESETTEKHVETITDHVNDKISAKVDEAIVVSESLTDEKSPTSSKTIEREDETVETAKAGEAVTITEEKPLTNDADNSVDKTPFEATTVGVTGAITSADPATDDTNKTLFGTAVAGMAGTITSAVSSLADTKITTNNSDVSRDENTNNTNEKANEMVVDTVKNSEILTNDEDHSNHSDAPPVEVTAVGMTGAIPELTSHNSDKSDGKPPFGVTTIGMAGAIAAAIKAESTTNKTTIETEPPHNEKTPNTSDKTKKN